MSLYPISIHGPLYTLLTDNQTESIKSLPIHLCKKQERWIANGVFAILEYRVEFLGGTQSVTGWKGVFWHEALTEEHTSGGS